MGGFPCQDYSVASSLATAKGLEGKKGVLWWSIRETIEKKKPPFILLENVDRLLKSPAKQRGRDFGVILACFRDEGYTVEWRVINAADYGYQQRRRRIFIFAYRNDTRYAGKNAINIEREKCAVAQICENGFFASVFKVNKADEKMLLSTDLPQELGELSEKFRFGFENSGLMTKGKVFTVKTEPYYEGKYITLGDIIEHGNVEEKYFIPENRLYYTVPDVNHSDETDNRLSVEQRKTWQYIKGAKKMPRKAANGHEYIYSEGPVPMIDAYNKPARTMLTSEGGFSRTTHIVEDRQSGKIRLLTAVEAERIQGFPDDYTRFCLMNGKEVEVPLNKRRFMMGNALVVDLIKQMEPMLSRIFDEEG